MTLAQTRTDVRAAVASYFGGTKDTANHARYTGGAIAALGAVYATPPQKFSAEDLRLGVPVGTPGGAVATIRLDKAKESRVAGSRGAGIKRIAYDAILDVYHHYLLEDTGLATEDLDVLLDAIVARLRADPTLAGTVFSAGEGDISLTGGMESRIEVEVGLPTVGGGGGIETAAVVMFGLVTHITA